MSIDANTDAATADSTGNLMGEDALRSAMAEHDVQDIFRPSDSATPEAGTRAPAPDDSPEDATEKAEDASEDSKTEKTDRSEKDEARRGKTWDEINREKEALAQERQRLQSERDQVERQAAAVEDGAKKALSSAEDYERFAQDWNNEGREDLAKQAMAKAGELRKQAFEIQRNHELKKLVTENPDLRNPESDLTKGVDALLKSRPHLVNHVTGIRDAVEFVKAQGAQKRLAEVEKELAETKQRLADREKLLQPATGGRPGRQLSSREFSKLPSADRETQLRRALREAEQAGVNIFTER